MAFSDDLKNLGVETIDIEQLKELANQQLREQFEAQCQRTEEPKVFRWKRGVLTSFDGPFKSRQ